MTQLLYLLIPTILSGIGTPKDQNKLSFDNNKGEEVSFNIQLEGQNKLVRYANRYEQTEIATFVENIGIGENDLEKAVRLINQKDRFKSPLNDFFEPGVSTAGHKLKKRPQALMNDIDPNTPINSDLENPQAIPGTIGYSSQAVVDFNGLQLGDTLVIYYNSGEDSKREYSFIVVDRPFINSYGKTRLEIPLGADQTTSEYLGVKVRFGSNHGFTKFENGEVSYTIEIQRNLVLPETTSAKPISKRRAKKRRS